MCPGRVPAHRWAMTTHEPGDIYRLDDQPRTRVRDIGLVTTALAFAGVFAIAGGDMPVAGEPPPAAAPAASPGDECGPLWDRVRVLDLPEVSWDLAATAIGLTSRGGWISADGLTWEHLDGRTAVVATPRAAASTSKTDCPTGADTDETSRA